MLIRKMALVGATGALVATALTAPTAQAHDADRATADRATAAVASVALDRADILPGDEVVFRTGTLTTADRPAGYPTAQLPYAQITGVTVRHDIRGGLLQMTATLAAPPIDTGYGRSGVSIEMGIGTYEGAECDTSIYDSNDAYIPVPESSYGDQWSQSGNVISFTEQGSGYDYDPGYNCVVAKTTYSDDDYNRYYDLVQGTMADDYGVPNLQTPTKKVNLARGTFSLVPVDITNVGTSSASVVVTGKGKGVKVTKTTIAKVSSTTSAIAWLPIKLTKNKVKTIKLKMTSVGKTNTATIRAKAVKRPKKAKTGQYGGGVAEFEVTGGSVPRVKDFTGSISTACDGIPTQNLTFQIPLSLRIWPNGQVQGTVATDDYVIQVQMMVVGKRAKMGAVRYQNAGVGCAGETPFNAQRLGR